MKKRGLVIISFLITLIFLLVSCGSNEQSRVRPVKPAPNAVWVPGHWKWIWVGPPGKQRRKRVWVPGHWRVP